MEAAGRADDFAARTKVQVVGVAEQDLGTRLGDLLRGEPLHRGLGAHRHEDRRTDLPVGGLQHAKACGRRRISLKQGEHGRKLGGRLAGWQGERAERREGGKWAR